MGNNSSSSTKSKPYPSAKSSTRDPPHNASQSSRHSRDPDGTNERHAHTPPTSNKNPSFGHQDSQGRSSASEQIPPWKTFQQGNSTDHGQSSTLQLPVLLALAERETSYIVLYLKLHSPQFSKTLQESESNPSIVVLMKIIRKICIADSNTSDQTQILKLVCCDKFLNSLNNYVLSLPTRSSDCTREDLLFIEDCVIQFVDKALTLFPKLICVKLKRLFINVNMAVNAIERYQNIKVNSSTTEKLKKIENILNFHLLHHHLHFSSPSTTSQEGGAHTQGNSGVKDEEQLNKTTSHSDQAYQKQMEFVKKNVFPEIDRRFTTPAKRVYGMCKNMYFVNKEEKSKDCVENAEYIFAVAKHLVKNGYEPKSILLLVTTDKEMEIFETVQNKYSSLKVVRVGILNKMRKFYASIVVVSLMGIELEDLTFSVYDVRQFCSAFSQSRCGFYMKGNITFLESKSIFWREMNSILKKYQAISSELPLQCKIHHSVVTEAGETGDLIKLGGGGCTERCNMELNCGHNCKRHCHLNDRTHKNYKCREKCTRTPLKCLSRHSCPKLCHEECGPCTVKININNTVIMCHEQNTQNQNQNFSSSTENKNVTVLPCGHIGSLEDTSGRKLDLWLPLNNCQNPCTGILQCGHECTGTCGQCRQGRVHIPCQKKRKVSLACGHRLHTSCSTRNVKCGSKCLYKCPHGECKEKCGAPCTPCLELCTLGCQHSKCTKKCSEMCDRLPCMASCQNRLDCGHQCVGMCGEPCPPGPEYCKVCNPEFFAERDTSGAARFVLLADCNHVVRCKKLDELVSKGIHKIEALVCPACGICITKTTRYLNHAKQLHTNLVTIRNVHEQSNENMSTTFWKIAKEIKSYSLPSNIEKHPKMEEIKSHFPSSKADKVDHKAVILIMFLRNLVLPLVRGGTQMASPNHLDWFLNVLLERIEMGASPQVLKELYREIIEYQRIQGNVFKEQLLELHKTIAFSLNLEKNTWAECTKGHLFSFDSLLEKCGFCEKNL